SRICAFFTRCLAGDAFSAAVRAETSECFSTTLECIFRPSARSASTTLAPHSGEMLVTLWPGSLGLLILSLIEAGDLQPCGHGVSRIVLEIPAMDAVPRRHEHPVLGRTASFRIIHQVARSVGALFGVPVKLDDHQAGMLEIAVTDRIDDAFSR